jgi:hypothetical protein
METTASAPSPRSPALAATGSSPVASGSEQPEAAGALPTAAALAGPNWLPALHSLLQEASDALKVCVTVSVSGPGVASATCNAHTGLRASLCVVFYTHLHMVFILTCIMAAKSLQRDANTCYHCNTCQGLIKLPLPLVCFDLLSSPFQVNPHKVFITYNNRKTIERCLVCWLGCRCSRTATLCPDCSWAHPTRTSCNDSTIG